MKYDNKVVTKDGITLMTQSISDKAEPIMDKMLVLNTDIPNGKVLEEMNLSDFNNSLSFDVNNVSQNDTSFTASAVISNNGINQDYSANLIGISGYLSNSDDRKLFAVAKASEPFVLTRKSETPLTLVPSITIGFSNSQNVQLTVKNDVYVTNQALEDLKNNLIIKLNNIDLSGATKSANNYTDNQLKSYTNTVDLNKELASKQPLGNYASPDDVNNAENRANSHSDSNRDNLQEQINSKQPTGDYVTNEDLNPKLNQKQDAGSYLTTDEFNKYGLSINDDKLMYGDKPVLIANAPNAPKINVSMNINTGNLDYQIMPPSIDGGASITSYKLKYKKESDNDWQTINVDATSLNGSLKSLEKGINYQFKAFALNYAGKSEDSEIEQISLANVPSGVSIDVSNDYPNGIKYNINVANNGGIDNIYYQIIYKKVDDKDWQYLNHIDKNGILGQIKDTTNYQFKAQAGNLAGLSLESETQNISYHIKDLNYVVTNMEAIDPYGKTTGGVIDKVRITIDNKSVPYIKIRVIQTNNISSSNMNIQRLLNSSKDDDADTDTFNQMETIFPVNQSEIDFKTNVQWGMNYGWHIVLFAEGLDQNSNSLNIFTKLYIY